MVSVKESLLTYCRTGYTYGRPHLWAAGNNTTTLDRLVSSVGEIKIKTTWKTETWLYAKIKPMHRRPWQFIMIQFFKIILIFHYYHDKNCAHRALKCRIYGKITEFLIICYWYLFSNEKRNEIVKGYEFLRLIVNSQCIQSRINYKHFFQVLLDRDILRNL